MKNVTTTALYGALAALIYRLSEYGAATIEPMLQSAGALGPDHWSWQATLLFVYLAAGSIIGAAIALFRIADPARTATRAVVFVLLLALAAGQLYSRSATAPNLVLVLCFLLIAVFVGAGQFLSQARPWYAWMCSPWIVFPLVMVLIKLKVRSGGAVAFGGAALGLWAAVALSVFALSSSRIVRSALNGRFLPLSAAASIALLIGLSRLSFGLDALAPIPPARMAGNSQGVPPNVVLIVMDTVRADHLSIYGYGRRTTPNLEALAREGVLFRNAISASDVTLSSYGSLFTGLYPSWHGAHLIPGKPPGRLAPSFRTMAQILSEDGYSTVAVLANCAYMVPVSGMDHGFDVYDVRRLINGSWAGEEYYVRDLLRQVLKNFISTTDLNRPYRRADQITDRGLLALETLRQRKSPFFLTLNYMDAHAPYLPPEPYRSRFPGYDAQLNTTHIYDDLEHNLALLRRPPAAATQLSHIASQYDAGIAYIDTELKRFVDGIKKAGVYDNTLIMVTADHGEALGERSALGHPASVHQELVHVPLLVKYPRSVSVKPGQQVDRLVSGVDVLPTVLQVAGVSIPANLQGQSLIQASGENRAVISESFPDGLSRLRRRADLGQRALYRGQWKFIGSTSGQRELYDLSRDPGEAQDFYKQDDTVSQQFSNELDQWVRMLPRRNISPSPTDAQNMKRLRSLGYVQ